MPLTRRSVLFGSAALLAGLSTTSCSHGGRSLTGFPSATEAMGVMRKLVKKVGRDTFQRVWIATDGLYTAKLLMPGGGVQPFKYGKDWQQDGDVDTSEFTSPVSAHLSTLPIDRLSKYLQAANAKVENIDISLDYVGKVRVTALVESEGVGLKLDGTGTVPELDPDAASEVTTAIAEIVAAYGTSAKAVGSFNGFVHVDANVAGCQAGVRIIREPRSAAQANIHGEKPFDTNLLFDPRDFDPTMAVTRKATIAKEAGVGGTVQDWTYERPPNGGTPLLSYGIGSDHRVWLDEHGKITDVTKGS